MKTRNIILGIATAILIAAPLALIAQGVPGGGNGGGSWGHGGSFGDGNGLDFLEHLLPRLAERLGLTDEQLEEIQAIVDEERPEIEELKGNMRTLHQTRREGHDPSVFNEGEVRAFAADLADIQVELMVAGERTRARILQVLTEEQRQQLDEMRDRFGKRSMHRPGGRRGQ